MNCDMWPLYGRIFAWGRNFVFGICKLKHKNVKNPKILKTVKKHVLPSLSNVNKFVRPRWPYDMQPSARAENYTRDAGP